MNNQYDDISIYHRKSNIMGQKHTQFDEKYELLDQTNGDETTLSDDQLSDDYDIIGVGVTTNLDPLGGDTSSVEDASFTTCDNEEKQLLPRTNFEDRQCPRSGDDISYDCDLSVETIDVQNETLMSLTIEIFLPFIVAGYGMVGAGVVLDIVQHWPVFEQINELFILVPALLGLKGNLEMTLASRLSTQVI